MPTFEQGDRVCVDITDATKSDFDWHGEHGRVINVLEEDAGEGTGDNWDTRLYRVELDEYNQQLDLRHRDLRSPLEE